VKEKNHWQIQNRQKEFPSPLHLEKRITDPGDCPFLFRFFYGGSGKRLPIRKTSRKPASIPEFLRRKQKETFAVCRASVRPKKTLCPPVYGFADVRRPKPLRNPKAGLLRPVFVAPFSDPAGSSVGKNRNLRYSLPCFKRRNDFDGQAPPSIL